MRILKERNGRSESQVGAKLHSCDNKRRAIATAIEHAAPKRRKDDKQKVKSSKNKRNPKNSGNSYPHSKYGSAFDLLSSPEVSDDNDEKDEFDKMCFGTGSTLSERIFGSVAM